MSLSRFSSRNTQDSQLYLRLQAHCLKLHYVHPFLQAQVLPLGPNYHRFLGIYEWHPMGFKQPMVVLGWGSISDEHREPPTVLTTHIAAASGPSAFLPHLAGLPICWCNTACWASLLFHCCWFPHSEGGKKPRDHQEAECL